MPTVAIVVVAAGSGERLGAHRAKAFVPIAGTPILARALHAVSQLSESVELVVVAPEADRGAAEGVLSTMNFPAGTHARVVVGGATRHQSVQAGLSELASPATESDIEVVLVHDAARPLVSARLFERVIEKVRDGGHGVVPALAVVDTLKRLDDQHTVRETVNRDELVAVQTPQGFPFDKLCSAYEAAHKAGSEFTDDAATFSAHGGTVLTVPGEANGFKITTQSDLERANLLVEAPQGVLSQTRVDSLDDLRVGYGADVHAFGEADNLWLAGVYWPGEPELSGHSDGDAAAHALCDALLAAAGLGDIGSVFGTDDPQFSNARGEVFVIHAVKLLHEAGFVPVNASVQVIGNRPKFAARRDEAEKVMSGWLAAPVSVSATTTDGLGLTGEGRGIAAIATVLVRARR